VRSRGCLNGCTQSDRHCPHRRWQTRPRATVGTEGGERLPQDLDSLGVAGYGNLCGCSEERENRQRYAYADGTHAASVMCPRGRLRLARRPWLGYFKNNCATFYLYLRTLSRQN
jgi:hypothetical protein